MENLPRFLCAAAILAVPAFVATSCDQGRGDAPTAIVDDATLQSQVDLLQDKVSAIRGLAFRKPVVARWVPRAGISALQDSLARALGYSTDTAGSGAMDEVFNALGYIDSTESVIGAGDDFLDQNAAAFYVKGTNHIWVVADQQEASDLTTTIAHELVHALQDQNFKDSVEDDAELDEAAAFQLLQEGEAEYVASLYQWGASTVQQWENSPGFVNFTPSRFASEMKKPGYRDLPPVISWGGYAPYLCGPSFVHKVRALSGWAGVDSLHKRPPRSTTQEFSASTSAGLHRTFVDWSTDYSFPSMSDRRSDDQGRLGELYLDALMATWGSPLVSGWNGDRFWVWGRGSGKGVAVAGRVSCSSPSTLLAGWAHGMDSIVGGRSTGSATDSIEFRASDSIHFARGMMKGGEVLMVWGDLRGRKLDSLWSDLSRVPAAGTFSRASGEVQDPGSRPKWKRPKPLLAPHVGFRP